MMNFEYADEFKKELKALKKRWRTLEADLERAKPAILSLYIPVEKVDINLYRTQFFGTKKAAIISTNDKAEAVKMRLDTDASGSHGKVRLIFVAIAKASSITFIELYSKSDKPREDTDRIKRYLKDS